MENLFVIINIMVMISYLCVRYLVYILKPDEFRLLMSDFSQIRNYGNKIIYKMFDYFDNIFNIN